MPTTARGDMGEEGGGFVWDQSARIMLAIVLVVVSAFVMYWIMA